MTGPRWAGRWHYEIRDLASLPPACGIDDLPCMSGPAWLRQIRRLKPGRARADCCWYHHVDWRAVSETAIRLARQAQAAGIPVADVTDAAGVASCGLGAADLEALDSLLSTQTGLMLADDDPGDQWIYEGRHRITAMRDAGVRRTPSRPPRAHQHCRRILVNRCPGLKANGE